MIRRVLQTERSEYNHWPPFVNGAIQWLHAHDPPPWDTLESRKRAAFVMGIAAHGLQDEVFDSLFLYQIAEHDDAGQDEADPGTDGFLFLDDHVRMRPQTYLPEDMLIDLYSELDEDVDRETIAQATNAMSIYLDEDIGQNLGESLGRDYEDEIPWARTHYLDPNLPGSLRAEITPTRHYLEAVWTRLHGEWNGEALVIHTYPAVPRRLVGHRADSPDSWVTFIFGEGVAYGAGEGRCSDAEDAEIAFDREDTRWGGPGDWTRLATFKPSADLVPGAYYTAGLVGDVETIGGDQSGLDYEFEFQVACIESNDEACPELDIDPPTIADPNAPDADADSGSADAGDPDSDAEDVFDSPDTALDARRDSSTAPATDASSNGCSTSPAHPAPPLSLALVLLAARIRRQSRRC